MNKPFPYLELFIIAAIVVLMGGFLFARQYVLSVILIGIFALSVLVALCINYADERAGELIHAYNTIASLNQQQVNQINYLLDRIQGIDPITNHSIHTPPIIKEDTGPKMVDFGTVEGVPVRRVSK